MVDPTEKATIGKMAERGDSEPVFVNVRHVIHHPPWLMRLHDTWREWRKENG